MGSATYGPGDFDRFNAEGSYTINYCVQDLLTGGDHPRNFLRDTLYTAYLQMQEENLHELLEQHFITRELSKLFRSKIKEEVTESALQLYIGFLEGEAADLLLQFCMLAIKGLTAELFSVNPEDYFNKPALAELSKSEQISYCLHVNNIVYWGNAGKLTDLTVFFDGITPNLFQLMASADRPVQRAAVWAFYSIKNWEILNEKKTSMDDDRQSLLKKLLEDDFDSNTKFRLGVLLLRNIGFVIPAPAEAFALKRAKGIYKDWAALETTILPDQVIPASIERVLIDLLDAPYRHWVENVAVPVLSCYGSEEGLKRLYRLMLNEPDTRFKAAVVLFQRGKLSASDFAFLKQAAPELDRWIISMSGHFVKKLKSKDTTGKMAYYFVLVEPENESNFNRLVSGNGTASLDDYGRVIASCYGEEPDQATKNFLKKEYGFFV